MQDLLGRRRFTPLLLALRLERDGERDCVGGTSGQGQGLGMWAEGRADVLPDLYNNARIHRTIRPPQIPPIHQWSIPTPVKHAPFRHASARGFTGFSASCWPAVSAAASVYVEGQGDDGSDGSVLVSW